MACTRPPSAIPDLDLEADAGLGLANNDPVALWADQSGNGNDATQGIGASQPTFKLADGPGGLPCVNFDGAADYLILPDLPYTQKYTVFAICSLASSALHTIVSGSSGALQFRLNNATKPQIARSGGTLIAEASSVTGAGFHQSVVAWDGSTGIFWIDGVLAGSQTNPTSLSVNPINRVGIDGADSNDFFNGSICMIQVFTNVLALDQIEAQMAANTLRWGV